MILTRKYGGFMANKVLNICLIFFAPILFVSSIHAKIYPITPIPTSVPHDENKAALSL
jgi:hypothetical protein